MIIPTSWISLFIMFIVLKFFCYVTMLSFFELYSVNSSSWQFNSNSNSTSCQVSAIPFQFKLLNWKQANSSIWNFFWLLNGSLLELEALHAENSGALYEQLFWGLSGLRDWIDIFVHRELLECKWSLWTSLSPLTWRIWSDDMHFYLPVSHKIGWKKPLVSPFTFRIVPAWQYTPFELNFFFL